MAVPSPGKNEWTLAFEDAALETAFLTERRERRTAGSTALSFVVGAVCWATVALLDPVFVPSAPGLVWMHLLMLVPVHVLGALLQLHGPTSKATWPVVQWVTSAAPGACVLIGLALAGPAFAQLGCLILSLYVMVLQTYAGFRAYQATWLGAVFVAAWTVGLVVQHAPVVAVAMPPLFSLLVGIRTGRQDERGRRRDFIARRTIESLLKSEISHQVAERSKQLGESLAQLNVALPSARVEPGQTFAERYRIVKELGRGGMGAVFEVERVTDGQALALKVVTGRVTGAQAARFAREAEIGARVRHPNLISIVDVGVSAAGTPFLVMVVRGGTFEGQRGNVVPVLVQVAAGLKALHDARVVHRDLKPQNILLSGGVARISDFGISRFGVLGADDPYGDTAAPAQGIQRPSLTQTGAVVGTPLYMAPEAARGVGAVGPPADVFAFGLIAYEALTGRMPYDVPVAMSGWREPAPLDGPHAEVVLACLREQPGERPTAAELLERFTTPAG